MARRRHGPLSAAELAEAAVLGDVALVLSFAGWLLPFPILFFAAATVPFAALTVRRRLRAVVIATVASGQVAFLLGGFTLELNHILVALIGVIVGLAYRWRWGWLKTALFAIPTVWLPTAIGAKAGSELIPYVAQVDYFRAAAGLPARASTSDGFVNVDASQFTDSWKIGSPGTTPTPGQDGVKELRLFISLYENVTLHPESRRARQLEAARRAVAAYEAVERELAAHAA